MSDTHLQPLPAEAEAFLHRVVTLPTTAWAEIIDERRRPASAELRMFLAGISAILKQRGSRNAARSAHSKAIKDRVQILALSGELPPEFGWRRYNAVSSAMHALVLRSTLSDSSFRALYGPFERFIPASSLGNPGELPDHLA